jgi:hypothetical protein
MSIAWPSFPGQAGRPSVEAINKNIIFESLGGQEVRVNVWPTGRYRFTFRYNGLRTLVAAPSPWAAYSEVGAVLYLIAQAKGAYDTFTFTDPVLGAITARMDTDSTMLDADPDGAPWYSGQVVFISIVGS